MTEHIPFDLRFIVGYFDYWHLGYISLLFSGKTMAIQDRLEVGFNHPDSVGSTALVYFATWCVVKRQ